MLPVEVLVAGRDPRLPYVSLIDNWQSGPVKNYRLWVHLLRQFVTEFFDQVGELSYGGIPDQ